MMTFLFYVNIVLSCLLLATSVGWWLLGNRKRAWGNLAALIAFLIFNLVLFR